MSTVLNFNAGPAALPRPVLEQVQAELLDYHGRGTSIMEMSHRSKEFEAINSRAEANFKRLIGAGEGYRALFVQGGASTQFATIPMNFLPKGGTADYLVTGTWGEKAIEEAAPFGQGHLAASTKEGGYKRVPTPAEIKLSPEPAYVHLTSNETIQGVQYAEFPDLGDAPLVADMSSDILSRPIDAGRFSLIYAGAQKNLGPSGLAVVLVRESWLERTNKGVPTILRFSTHAKNNSLYNTPPMFAIYVLDLVPAMARRPGRGRRDRRDERGEGRGDLRRDRRQRRLLPGPRRAGFAVPDEHHLPPAERGPGEAVRLRGPAGGDGRPGRAPLRRRHPGVDLQRDRPRVLPGPGDVHAGLRPEERLKAAPDHNPVGCRRGLRRRIGLDPTAPDRTPKTTLIPIGGATRHPGPDRRPNPRSFASWRIACW